MLSESDSMALESQRFWQVTIEMWYQSRDFPLSAQLVSSTWPFNSPFCQPSLSVSLISSIGKSLEWRQCAIWETQTLQSWTRTRWKNLLSEVFVTSRFFQRAIQTQCLDLNHHSIAAGAISCPRHPYFTWICQKCPELGAQDTRLLLEEKLGVFPWSGYIYIIFIPCSSAGWVRDICNVFEREKDFCSPRLHLFDKKIQ